VPFFPFLFFLFFFFSFFFFLVYPLRSLSADIVAARPLFPAASSFIQRRYLSTSFFVGDTEDERVREINRVDDICDNFPRTVTFPLCADTLIRDPRIR